MAGQPPPGVVTFGPDSTCTLDSCPIEWSVYGYQPSVPVNAVFIGLFAIGGLVHAYLGFRWKTWWFMCCMIVFSINSCIGYGGRIWLHYEPFNFDAFMMQMSTWIHNSLALLSVVEADRRVSLRHHRSRLLLCSLLRYTRTNVSLVPWLESTRISHQRRLAIHDRRFHITYLDPLTSTRCSINYFAPELSRVKPVFFYFGFITCDIISLALQAAGGAMSSSSSGDDADSGEVGVDISLAGLAFQVATIMTFSCFLIDFIIRYFRSPQGRKAASIVGIRLKIFFSFMFFSMLLTVARSIYRVIELREGYDGDLIRDEPIFIALEGV